MELGGAVVSEQRQANHGAEGSRWDENRVDLIDGLQHSSEHGSGNAATRCGAASRWLPSSQAGRLVGLLLLLVALIGCSLLVLRTERFHGVMSGSEHAFGTVVSLRAATGPASLPPTSAPSPALYRSAAWRKRLPTDNQRRPAAVPPPDPAAVAADVHERLQSMAAANNCSTGAAASTIQCIMPPDNRQSEPYFVDPYSFTVFLQMSSSQGGIQGSGFIVNSMAPNPYVVIVTAGHNIIDQKGGFAYTSAYMWVPFTSIGVTVPNDLSQGCGFYASNGWTQSRDPTQGTDWGVIVCNPTLFGRDPFPPYGYGFGLLSDGTATQQLMAGIAAINSGFPGDKQLPPASNQVWYTTGQVTLDGDGRRINLGQMSTVAGQSGGPIFSTQFANYMGEYMAVGVESYQDVNGAQCVANWATYLSPVAVIELNWLVRRALALPLVALQNNQYQANDIEVDFNQPPDVQRGNYVPPPNLPLTQSFWFAKLSVPSSGGNQAPTYGIISGAVMAGPTIAGWAALSSNPAAGGGNPQCLVGTEQDNGCGTLYFVDTVLANFPATSVVIVNAANNVFGFNFCYQQPSVWARMPDPGQNPNLPNLQTGQGPYESWVPTANFF